MTKENSIVFETTIRLIRKVLLLDSQIPQKGPINKSHFPSMQKLDLPNLTEGDLTPTHPESIVLEYENRLNRDMELLVFDCSRNFLNPDDLLSPWTFLPLRSNLSLERDGLGVGDLPYRHFLSELTSGDLILLIREVESGNGVEEILVQKKIKLLEMTGKKIIVDERDEKILLELRNAE